MNKYEKKVLLRGYLRDDTGNLRYDLIRALFQGGVSIGRVPLDSHDVRWVFWDASCPCY